MRLTTTLAAAAAIAVSGVAANAGGLEAPIVEETPAEVMIPAPAGSMSTGLLILAAIAALMAASASAGSN